MESQRMVQIFSKDRSGCFWSCEVPREKESPIQSSSEESQTMDAFQEILTGEGMQSHFQPIGDFHKGAIHGYEVLSRGIFPLESPELFFGLARQQNLHKAMDRACFIKALETLALSKDFLRGRFFVNINPSSFCDPSFRELLHPQHVKSYGLSPERIILELTEGERAEDYGDVSSAAEELKNMGYGLALDDLGAGYSGFRTVALCLPEYIKMDMRMIRHIHTSAVRQKILSGVREFAHVLGAQVIAEGVESHEELQTLVSLGVRFVQGFFLDRPRPYHQIARNSTTCRIRELKGSLDSGFDEDLEKVISLAERGLAVEEGTLNVEEAGKLFSRHKNLDHLVILARGYPVGLLTKNGYNLATGGAFGYHLYQKHPVEEIASRDFLKVSASCSITEAAKMATERDEEGLYDPLLVVGPRGNFLGSVTMKRIIERAGTLEVAMAKSCNPLSGLPGNSHIERWILAMQHSEEAEGSLIYVDLDRFKEYNDRYGFLQGDRMIGLTASVLHKAQDFFPSKSRLGHVGGDDFVLVCEGQAPSDSLDKLCSLFDEEKRVLFDEKDFRQGEYKAKNRSGMVGYVPLTTVSCAVVDMANILERFNDCDCHQLSCLVAFLKGQVKQKTALQRKSDWLRWDGQPLQGGEGDSRDSP